MGGAFGRKHIKHHHGQSFVGPVVNLRNIHIEPNHDGWCGCLHGQLCTRVFVTARRRCVASVGGSFGRKHIKHHRGLSFVTAVVNLRNIPTEPNHDGWCGCLHDQLCKQTFVYVRGRCHGGAWQVWELQLVANTSNAIADYHLLHLW